MMNNSDRLDKSAKAESLYKFFKDNAFLTSGNVQLKSNYSRGKESPWSLAFAGHCVTPKASIPSPHPAVTALWSRLFLRLRTADFPQQRSGTFSRFSDGRMPA